MKLYILCSMLLSGGIISAMGAGSGNQNPSSSPHVPSGPPAIRRVNNGRALFQGAQPAAAAAASSASSGNAATPLLSHYQAFISMHHGLANQAAAASSASSSYVQHFSLEHDFDQVLRLINNAEGIISLLDQRAKMHRGPLDRLQSSLDEVVESKDLHESYKTMLLSEAKSLKRVSQAKIADYFAKAVNWACKRGHPLILKTLLSYNNQDPIEIRATVNLHHLFIPVSASQDNPVDVVYNSRHHVDLKKDMLKILAVDKRSHFSGILKAAHQRYDIDTVKLVLFILQGNEVINIARLGWASEPLQLLYDGLNDMTQLSAHYTPAELAEYRQLLLEREGITPEHLIKAVKGRHAYMAKAILYNADNDFEKELKAQQVGNDGIAMPSLLDQAYIEAHKNNDPVMHDMVKNRGEIRGYMDEQELKESANHFKQKNLGNKNPIAYALNRQIGPQFAAHQGAKQRLVNNAKAAQVARETAALEAIAQAAHEKAALEYVKNAGDQQLKKQRR